MTRNSYQATTWRNPLVESFHGRLRDECLGDATDKPFRRALTV